MLTPAYLTATTFQKELSTGRTKPCVFSCEDANGAPAGEYVVKLRANLNMPDTASMFEMVGALLADELGMSVPVPAFVEIDPALADGIMDLGVGGSVRNSAGINFGSEYKSGGYVAWQPERKVPDHLLDQAFDVFAFDAFIDNPDRRVVKPNLLTDGDEIVVIDHESAFAFVLDVLSGLDTSPWDLARTPYLDDHVFLSDLRRLIPRFSRIREALETITRERWGELEGILPDAWKSDHCDKVGDRLLSVIEHLDSFITAAKAKLQ